MLFKQRDHPVVEQIGRGQRRLAIINLGPHHLAVGIDKGLLIDPAHSLESADIESILCSTVPRTFTFEFTVSFLLRFGLLQGCHLRLAQNQPVLLALGRQSF